MITTNSIKLIAANFDHYLLTVDLATEIDQIAAKLDSLRKFDKHAKYIVLEYDLNNFPDAKQLTAKTLQIEQLCQKNNCELVFIQANQFIDFDKISQTTVRNLPITNKSKPIYNQTLIIDEPVRSGIRIENDGDVLVNNLVSYNAELISTGNIYVYGDCRGRLIAGRGGNKAARIFVVRFNAQLISIAGIFRSLETKLPVDILDKPVQVFLDEKERLNVIPLNF